MWLGAEYEFGSMFSYRIPNFSPSFALSSPIPGPSTIKLAIVATAIERSKNLDYGKDIFDIIKSSKVLIKLPERISISKALIKRLKRMREGYIDKTFGIREYVHFSEPLGVYIQISSSRKDEIKEIMRRVKYFGTSDSLVTCKCIRENEPDENICAKPLKTLETVDEDARSWKIGDLVIPLFDIKNGARFSDISPYESGSREIFISIPYEFPLKIEKEGKNWIIYRRLS